MPETKVVLLEQDDLMHPNTGESNFNESAYYNFYDRGQRLGGFIRLGNRANEGYAEMTACLYLPDGTVGFMFQRPEIKNNDAHNAGGAKFEVVKPFEHHRVSYHGKLCMLKNPLEMADPAKAFKTIPTRKLRWKLITSLRLPDGAANCARRTGDQWVSPKPSGNPEAQFAKGHLEQLGHATGKLVLTTDGVDREFKIDALGLRDHSWGPRYWQAPKYYRWLTMNFDEDLGGMATITVNRDGSERPGGFIARKGKPFLNIVKVDVQTEFVGEQQLHDKITATCQTADGGTPIVITGKVLSMIPLRNRRAGIVTRIAEGMTEWQWDGKIGYGLSEYLDHFDE